MPRARTGSIRVRGDRIEASVPRAVGATGRRAKTFPNDAAGRQLAQQWVNDQLNLLDAPTPDATSKNPLPDSSPTVAGPRRPGAAAAWRLPNGLHDLRAVADSWHHQRYEQLRAADPERARTVRALANNLLAWLAAQQVSAVEDIDNALAASYAAALAGQDAEDDQASVTLADPGPPTGEPAPTTTNTASAPGTEAGATGLADTDLLPVRAAAQLSHVSLSTLKRARGQLPGWHLVDGRAVVPVRELRNAGLLPRVGAATANPPRRRGPRQHGDGYSRGVADDYLFVLRGILAHAQANGVVLTGQPMLGVRGVEPDDARRKTPRDDQNRRLVPLRTAREVAGLIHLIHQASFWMTRLMGMRPTETYGPRVEQLVAVDGGAHALVLGRLGGRPFITRGPTGLVVATDEKDTPKTPLSVRTVPVPRQLVELFDILIAAFHTDPDTGVVDLGARLVPGIRHPDRSGLVGLQHALARATQELHLTRDALGYAINLKLQRASFITDMEHRGTDDELRRLYVGHVPGRDVHSRHYLLQPEDPAAFANVLHSIEAQIDDELDGSLLIPTSHLPQFGRANPLWERRHHSAAVLAEHGLYVEPGTRPAAPTASQPATDLAATEGPPADPDPLLDAEQVAAQLGVAVVTARRWMAAGELATATISRGRRPVRMARASSVEALAEHRRTHPTVAELATTLRVTTAHLRTLGRDVGIDAEPQPHGPDRFGPEAVAALIELRARALAEAADSMTLASAAATLRLPVTSVETLLRRGTLVLYQALPVPGPNPGPARQLRRVTRASVQAELDRRTGRGPQHTTEAGSPADQRTLPVAQAARQLAVTRHEMTALITSGRLQAVEVERRQHVTVDSVQRLLARLRGDHARPNDGHQRQPHRLHRQQ